MSAPEQPGKSGAKRAPTSGSLCHLISLVIVLSIFQDCFLLDCAAIAGWRHHTISISSLARRRRMKEKGEEFFTWCAESKGKTAGLADWLFQQVISNSRTIWADLIALRALASAAACRLEGAESKQQWLLKYETADPLQSTSSTLEIFSILCWCWDIRNQSSKLGPVTPQSCLRR